MTTPVKLVDALSNNAVYGPIAVALSVAIVLTGTHLPAFGWVWNAWQNAGHGLVFAALGCYVFLAIGKQHERRSWWLAACARALLLFALGLAIEGVQHLSGRGADSQDIWRNGLGIVSALALTAAGRSGSLTVRVCLSAFTTTALLLCLERPLRLMLAKAVAPPAPMLVDVEYVDSLVWLVPNTPNSTLTRVSGFPGWRTDSHVLQLNLPAGRWPGMRLVEPGGDWRIATALRMESFNPAENNVTLRIRADVGRGTNEHRYWAAIDVPPGASTPTMPVHLLKDMNAEHTFTEAVSSGNVTQLVFYVYEISTPISLFIDDIRLQN